MDAWGIRRGGKLLFLSIFDNLRLFLSLKIKKIKLPLTKFHKPSVLAPDRVNLIMYQRKIKEEFDYCGITIAMRVFGAKWKPCILHAIFQGFTRPSEIHRQIPEAKPRVLDIQLSELLKLGVLTKETGAGFPLYTRYNLTELGKSIIPIVLRLDKWGNTHKDLVMDKLSEAV